MVKLILITHGNLGQSLVETASTICCCAASSKITVFSVSGKVNLGEIENKIKTNMCQEGTIILVDTFGGTACNIALKCVLNQDNVAIIPGVNLNMVLTALNNYDKLAFKALADKIINDGKRAIFEATEFVKK